MNSLARCRPVSFRTGALCLLLAACSSGGSGSSGAASQSGGAASGGASGSPLSDAGGSPSGWAGAGSSTGGAAGNTGASSSGAGAGTSGAASGSSLPSNDGGIAEGGAGADGGAVAQACGSLPLCDGFESDTAGMAPDPTLWHLDMGCNPTQLNGPAPDGGLLIEVDDAQHHSGAQSLRVAGGDSCGRYAINASAFAQLGQQIYARFYARFSGDPMGDGGVATANHNGFLSMYSGTAEMVSSGNFFANYAHPAAPNTGELRLGCQSGVLDWNSIINSADSTLPDLSPMGIMQSVSPRANEWDCYEFHIDQTSGHIEFWLNSNSVPGLTWDGTSAQGTETGWTNAPPPPLTLQTFGLGWLQLSVGETAWYDDVVLSNGRVGCL